MARPSVWHVKMTKPARGFKAGEVVEVPTQAHPAHAERWLIDDYAVLYTKPATTENKRAKRKDSKVVAAG